MIFVGRKQVAQSAQIGRREFGVARGERGGPLPGLGHEPGAVHKLRNVLLVPAQGKPPSAADDAVEALVVWVHGEVGGADAGTVYPEAFLGEPDRRKSSDLLRENRATSEPEKNAEKNNSMRSIIISVSIPPLYT